MNKASNKALRRGMWSPAERWLMTADPCGKAQQVAVEILLAHGHGRSQIHAIVSDITMADLRKLPIGSTPLQMIDGGLRTTRPPVIKLTGQSVRWQTPMAATFVGTRTGSNGRKELRTHSAKAFQRSVDHSGTGLTSYLFPIGQKGRDRIGCTENEKACRISSLLVDRTKRSTGHPARLVWHHRVIGRLVLAMTITVTRIGGEMGRASRTMRGTKLKRHVGHPVQMHQVLGRACQTTGTTCVIRSLGDMQPVRMIIAETDTPS